MESNKTVLTSFIVIFAALVPTFSYADAERAAPCNVETATTAAVVADKDKTDAMEDRVNELVNSTEDPILASYYRDLYNAPASLSSVTFVRVPDPYVDALSKAFYGAVEPDSQRALKVCKTRTAS